ncbi:4609_t:CDS:10 [Funneliformis caledonium]|uniref:Coronin n=1 Tax=Funneliformis caledonium TaxID=1117310 RepID=A0A9N9H6A5_9GLOM|nr:4609_t:CDS:10 [Funneliformis caledonium]
MCKHILNAQVSIRAPCCKRWFDCAECHAEASDHELAKSIEMVFACKKCKKCFRKDLENFDETDEYCPHCDNHYVLEAKTPSFGIGVEGDDPRLDNRLIKDERIKQDPKKSIFNQDITYRMDRIRRKNYLLFQVIPISSNAWDTNLVKVNPSFVSINWNAGGGGAFAVIPHKNVGKIHDGIPLYRAHTAPVLDTDFANFNDNVIASCGEDSKVMIWTVPEELGEPESPDIEPVSKLTGHGRKVGHVLFHPVADNVLASSSADLTIKLWDIEKGVEKQELKGFLDFVQSMSWNWNGSLMVTTCRDKKLRIFDVRSSKVVQEAASHQGIKGSRVVWLGDTERLATTGFSKMSDRQVYLWDSTQLEKPIKTMMLDTSSGIVMPFYDEDTKILYLAGKGSVKDVLKTDGNIRYYEFENDELFFLSEYKSSEPQRGMAFMPKRGVNVNECEITKAYKVTSNCIEPISFVVPRRSDGFQPDLFPPALSDEPALTADEFFGGKNANPKTIDLENGFVAKEKKEFVSSAPKEEEKIPKTEKDVCFKEA